MTDESAQCVNSLQASKFCSNNIDVSNFLNLNSLQDHSEFCLAYIFTYRDFTQGTLGLAWVGSSGRKFYYIHIVFMYASNFDSLTKSKDSEHDSINVLFECGRLWVWAMAMSNQRPGNWYFLFLR